MADPDAAPHVLRIALVAPALERMCYHVYMQRRRLGVRAMRQNLSVYLRRAAAGESFEVTLRARPVAVLAPVEAGLDPIERLVASGRASPPAGDLLALGPPGPVDRSRRLSRALQEQRAERS
jgi:prevent-host-death family protein